MNSTITKSHRAGITFYIGAGRHGGWIHYDLHGYLPGEYQTAPTVVRDAYRPEQIAVGKVKPLTVLSLGGTSADKYRLTPQELYELGRRYFDKKNWAESGKQLDELVKRYNGNLKPAVYQQTARMLLDVRLETGPASQVVKYFEIIRERFPELELSFDKIMKVGAAYHEMGEYERSYLVFRATVESSFSREAGVAGFVESQGEFERSVEVMERLLRQYPPENYVAAASYALAQRVYAKAPEAKDDPKLREAKVHRVDLISRAHQRLENFLTEYPADPAADQAAFSAANALLELENFDAAIGACTKYAKRYPKSDLLDSYWYLIGYCHFAEGNHDEALEWCRKVAETQRTDRQTGRARDSVNKWRAVYILGQIYHSLGKAAEAIDQYTKVKERFADAKQAIEYFARKEIKLPEVTTLEPGKKVEVELKYRNVAACDLRVYRIDLMKFSLLRRDLNEITRINLAGIRPLHEADVELGDGKDYADRDKKLALPIEGEGAYLVVCRGADLHTSGLVLVTPLEIEVQQEQASGRVRTTIKDKMDGKYISDVHVKVIGSANKDFVSGDSDLRGVFVADGIRGRSTVIAQTEDRRYAFFRGEINLAMAEAPRPTSGKPSGPAKPNASKDGELLDGLQEQNSILQQQEKSNLQKLYDQKQDGVKAKKAF